MRYDKCKCNTETLSTKETHTIPFKITIVRCNVCKKIKNIYPTPEEPKCI